MSSTVKQRFVHMTARKLRLVADMVRGKSTTSAITTLQVMPRVAAQPVLHAIKSAVNAEKNKQDGRPLLITSIMIDEGPALKRRILRSRGRASRMEHRMSHITVTVTPNENKGAPKLQANKRKDHE